MPKIYFKVLNGIQLMYLTEASQSNYSLAQENGTAIFQTSEDVAPEESIGYL